MPEPDESARWEKILDDAGLSMGRGHSGIEYFSDLRSSTATKFDYSLGWKPAKCGVSPRGTLSAEALEDIRKRDKISSRKRYAKRKTEGRCLMCGRLREDSRTICAHCREWRSNYGKTEKVRAMERERMRRFRARKTLGS